MYVHVHVVYLYKIMHVDSHMHTYSSTNGTRPLAVVAADLTISSVRTFLRAAVPGCEEDTSTSCFIIDDLGNLVYDRDLLNNVEFDSRPRFLGEPVGSTDYFEVSGHVNCHP